MDAQQIIEALGLRPHPEVGYFAETYRSEETFSARALPDRYPGDRPVSTAIYYLLTPDTFSEVHRLQSDEIFHLHARDNLRAERRDRNSSASLASSHGQGS